MMPIQYRCLCLQFPNKVKIELIYILFLTFLPSKSLLCHGLRFLQSHTSFPLHPRPQWTFPSQNPRPTFDLYLHPKMQR